MAGKPPEPQAKQRVARPSMRLPVGVASESELDDGELVFAPRVDGLLHGVLRGLSAS